MRFQFDNENDRALAVNSLRVAAVQYGIDADTSKRFPIEGEGGPAALSRIVEQFKRQQADVLRIADAIEEDGP